MNKRKLFMRYGAVPVLGLSALVGVHTASAHGLFGGMRDNASPEQIATQQQNIFQNEATLLGISVDDVKNAWAEGKSIKELAKDHGITEEQLQQKMKDARLQQMKLQLQTLVDKGIITQAQADKRLTTMQNLSGKAAGRMGMRFHKR